MITTLDRYPLRPGLLVEWIPEPVGAAYCVEDVRAPSYLQEEHIRAEVLFREQGVRASSWLATAFDLPGRVELEAMHSLLCTVLARHESLRSEFRFDGVRLARHTHPSSHVRLRMHVVGEFDSGARIASYLEGRFDEATNPLDNPLPTVFAAIVRPESTTALLASDHSRTDGYSLFLVPHEFAQLRAAQQDGRLYELADVDSHVDHSHAERSRAAAIDADHRGVLVWKRFLDACGGALPEFPVDRGVADGEVPEWAGLHETVLSEDDAEAFGVACKEAGVQFLSGLVAATATAAREIGGSREFHTTVPVHTRSARGAEGSLGWYVNSLPISVRTADAVDFRTVATATHGALRTALPALKVPCSRAWELTGTFPLLRTMISFMDLRNTPGSEHWAEWNVSGLGKPPPGDHVFLWFIRTRHGTSLTAVFPDTVAGNEIIPRIAARIGEVLTTVAATGNRSPLPVPA
ncbi:Condensation domain-containing protein [Jatrophihabitans endophyticus]|uniref:Condensation domain-containing protein n=1 Tax=Jatrophihabitans endophyticus TaxID=1206085 RepID=A0A1M5LY94_9ACTN|nr:condensation domain-containing protein [Jatrophihabitans endophyticus]SHG70037.1 Condensation domain-containing protein [Jatrophihabitans endophyticus]